MRGLAYDIVVRMGIAGKVSVRDAAEEAEEQDAEGLNIFMHYYIYTY